MRDFRGKRALVTGAASGIGRATAIALAREGAELILCDVDAAGMEATAKDIRALGRDVLARKVDVSERDAMRAFADEVHATKGALDVLVNNAGVGLGGTFLETSLEDWDWILGINLRGVVHGCHFFLPEMVEAQSRRPPRERQRGRHVVNVSSAAGYTPTPTLAAYCTTKYGVLGLSECLRIELAEHGIGVTAICPGIINTPITRNTRLVGKAARPGAQEQVVRFYEKRNYGPEKVAAEIVRAIRHDRAIVPVSPEAWAFYFAKRASPTLFHKISAAMTKRFDAMVDR